MEIVRYKLSKDKKGLLGYFKSKKGVSFYHIHTNELSPLEKWIKKVLKKLDRYI